MASDKDSELWEAIRENQRTAARIEGKMDAMLARLDARLDVMARRIEGKLAAITTVIPNGPKPEPMDDEDDEREEKLRRYALCNVVTEDGLQRNVTYAYGNMHRLTEGAIRAISMGLESQPWIAEKRDTTSVGQFPNGVKKAIHVKPMTTISAGSDHACVPGLFVVEVACMAGIVCPLDVPSEQLAMERVLESLREVKFFEKLGERITADCTSPTTRKKRIVLYVFVCKGNTEHVPEPFRLIVNGQVRWNNNSC